MTQTAHKTLARHCDLSNTQLEGEFMPGLYCRTATKKISCQPICCKQAPAVPRLCPGGAGRSVTSHRSAARCTLHRSVEQRASPPKQHTANGRLLPASVLLTTTTNHEFLYTYTIRKQTTLTNRTTLGWAAIYCYEIFCSVQLTGAGAGQGRAGKAK